ncbi:MAG: radical SAM protein [Patescibacteria group bacterium]|jgi:radical SAM protein with 4Fe4S-binding SPASM domain
MQRLSGPIDVQLELTENCNFRCRHCYNFWRYCQTSSKDELNTAQVLNVIATLHDHGVSVITLTGGEPLLRPSVLFTALMEAKRLGMEVGLNTNAALVTSTIASRLKSEGLDHVLCSILGREETHNHITGAKDGYSQTIGGIEYLVQAGLSVAANMVVSTLNRGEVIEVGRIVSGLGVSTFCATPMVPSHESNRCYVLSSSECKQALKDLLVVGETFSVNVDTLEPIARCLFDEAEEDEFISFFGNLICSAAVSSCAISSTGMVQPCIHADKSFGNMLQENLADIWTRMAPWTEESMLPVECIACEATAICENGCRMSSKALHGCYNGKDMYMSEPIRDRTRIAKLPVRKKLDGSVAAEDRVRVNPLARFRQESFGGIVYVGTNVEFLTPVGFHVVQSMRQKGTFSPAELAPEVGLTNDDVVAIVSRLLGNKAILPV